jgi:transposase
MEEPTITKTKKGAAGLEFHKEHAHCFFDMKEIVHCKFVPPNTTVNSDFYCDVLRRLKENVRGKKQELRGNHNWFLHHNNAPAHMSLKTIQFVTNINMVIVPYPPYPPDLAPCDFAFFPKLKMKLKGQCFDIVSDIQRESQAVLASIKENDFHSASEAWKKQWDCCIRSQGDYFEGEGTQNCVS